MSPDVAIAKALRLIGEAEAETLAAPFTRQMSGLPVDRLPIPDEADAERLTALGSRLLALAAEIDVTALPPDLATTVKVAAGLAERWSKAAQRWWLVYDPAGIGFYAMFGPTAYGGGFALDSAVSLLSRQSFARRGDFDRYLGLVDDLAGSVEAMRVRLEGQAARQIVMPAAQLAQARPLVRRLAGSAAQRLRPARDRLADLDGADAFLGELDGRLAGSLAPSFERLSAVLDGDYGERAGEPVGLSRYPGGRELYEELVAHYLTLNMTPEAVHAAGFERMGQVRAGMASLRAEIGFAGDDHAYLDAMAADPRWRESTADGVAGVFRRYIERLKPHMAALFRFGPKAGYDVAPLPEALAGSMTFGFYQAPLKPGADGTYLFNAGNLTQAGLGNIAALNYHELVPGHHFHLASQMENDLLPPLRKHAFVNAFNEGWAEYASALAGEAGCYAAPEERFGRLVMDAFLTCRLVVDTGMNALGWSLERARDYMRENSFMSEREIATETIRYACDIPGQSLAYKLGDTFLFKERERMRAALGPRFDIRDFHDAVLKPGALPLPLVAENVDRAIAAGG